MAGSGSKSGSKSTTRPKFSWHFFRCRMFFRTSRQVSCVLLLFSLAVSAQVSVPNAPPAPPSKPQDPYERSSPASTVLAFLQACRSNNYSAATRYLDLRKLTPEERRKQGPRLAQQLAQALDNDPQFDLATLSHDSQGDLKDGLPPNRERVQTLNPKGRPADIQLEREDLRSGIAVWRFSADTVGLIPTLTH